MNSAGETVVTRRYAETPLPLERVRSQNARLHPFFDQVAYAWIRLPRASRRTTEICKAEEIKLGSKSDKVGEETVEVTLATEMNQMGELRVVDVGEYAEELLVNVLGRRQKGRRKFTGW